MINMASVSIKSSEFYDTSSTLRMIPSSDTLTTSSSLYIFNKKFSVKKDFDYLIQCELLQSFIIQSSSISFIEDPTKNFTATSIIELTDINRMSFMNFTIKNSVTQNGVISILRAPVAASLMIQDSLIQNSSGLQSAVYVILATSSQIYNF